MFVRSCIDAMYRAAFPEMLWLCPRCRKRYKVKALARKRWFVRDVFTRYRRMQQVGKWPRCFVCRGNLKVL